MRETHLVHNILIFSGVSNFCTCKLKIFEALFDNNQSEMPDQVKRLRAK